MANREYFLVQVGTASGFSPYLTLAEVAYRCGLHPELIARLADLGLIDYVEGEVEGEVLFDADVIPLLRRILRLRNHLGVNYAGIGVILELMARIESLENHIRELESRI
jgi:MerR family transcriptional regulator, heat shock protein HspR